MTSTETPDGVTAITELEEHHHCHHTEDGPDADGLREALRARAVDPSHRYETVIGTVGFDANGDSTRQMVSSLRVDREAADGAGDWALIKQQDFGRP